MNSNEKLIDQNGLSPNSVKFAQYFNCISIRPYFIVNNAEVQLLKKKFNIIKDNKFISKMDVNKIIPPSRFMKMPFFSRITDVYCIYNNPLIVYCCLADSSMDWNEFFQFVIFFAFTPSVLHYYLLCTISFINPEKVSWTNICELATLFSNECYLDLRAEELFEKNHDGFLNLNQLYNFISRTFHIWEPMYSFEMFIIELYIPTSIYITIFERKINYNLIKSYQMSHRGRFPPESCLLFIKRIFTGLPHHYRFDYECGNYNGSISPTEDINVSDLLEIMIQRYMPMHRKQKIQYNLKYLTCFTADKLLVSKGNFYHKIFTNIYNEHSLSKSRSISRKSNNNTNTNTNTQQNTGRSLLDMYSTNNDNNSSTTGSILRSSSNYRDRSSSLFQRQHNTAHNHNHPMDLTINTNLMNNDIMNNNGSVRGCNYSSFNASSLTPKLLNNNRAIVICNNYKNDNSSILIHNNSDSNEKKNSNKDKDNSLSDNTPAIELSPKLNSSTTNPYATNTAPSPPRYNNNNNNNIVNNNNGSLFINGSHRIKLSFQASALLSSSFNETPVHKNRMTNSPQLQSQSQSQQQQQQQQQQQLQHQSITQLQLNNFSIGSPLHSHNRVMNVPGSIELDITNQSDDMV